MGTVLLVDDSPGDRALFRTILARAGFNVVEAVRGDQALSIARSARPEAIVLDVNLPDTDGHAVCQALKVDRELRGIPVLMLTVRDNDDDVLTGLEAGADDYVAKDAASSIVLARLRRLIQLRQLTSVAVLNEHLVQVGRLLAGIVHEIRGPLSVIRGSAELMKMQIGPGDPQEQWIDPILRSAQLLQVRLEHLMATVRSGPAILELVEPSPLVRESTEMFLKGIDPRGHLLQIQTECEEPLPYVRLDAGRLIQVLLALLGNAQEAIAGLNRDGVVLVKVGKAMDRGRQWVTVSVTDDGPGIPEEILGRVFEPFFTTKEGGSGYGLYLASEIVKEQGGMLTVSNARPLGACFTLWLPTEPSPASQNG
ncbi:MAG: sensor histidine kinase [Isosphaeraceae bacterium]